MGYGASYDCNLTLKSGVPDDFPDEIEKKIYNLLEGPSVDIIKRDSGVVVIFIDGYDDHFDDGDWCNIFEDVEPYIDYGEVEFAGEDGCKWRYMRYNDGWYEENAIITYDSKNKTKLI